MGDPYTKTPVEVAIFLKENGVCGDIWEVFEGDLLYVLYFQLRAHAFCGTLSHPGILCSLIPNLDFAENEIDGQAFCELSEDDIRLMTPKLGVVKKIHSLKTVMWRLCCVY